MESKEGTLRF